MTRADQIKAERARGDNVKDIAARHGVSRAYVYQITMPPPSRAQRLKRRAYMKRWRGDNPDKIAEYQRRLMADPIKAARIKASNQAALRRHRAKKRRAEYMAKYMKRRRADTAEKERGKAYDAVRNATPKRKRAMRKRDNEPLRRARQVHRKRLKRLLAKLEHRESK